MTPLARTIAIASAAALILTGCHAAKSGSAASAHAPNAAVFPPGALRLVAYTSCDDVIAGLNKAASAVVGPYGLPGGFGLDSRKYMAADGLAPQEATPGPAPTYSGTNTQDVDVNEPDLVKTDGRRIITVTNGVLRVIDAATHRQTGSVDLTSGHRLGQIDYGNAQLLLSGDRALVISQSLTPMVLRQPDAPRSEQVIKGPHLMLIDLSGAPTVLATYDIDGAYLDARQVGNVVRVVVQSAPRVSFPYQPNQTDAQRIAANKKIIGKLSVDEWLPRYTLTVGSSVSTGHLPCNQVQRPDVFSATNMLSVLTFDLGRPGLGTGDGTTIVADGDTVYATPNSLYIASDQRWRFPIEGPGQAMPNTGGIMAPDATGSAEAGQATAGPGVAAPGTAAPDRPAPAATTKDGNPAGTNAVEPAPTPIPGGTLVPQPPKPQPKTEIYRFDTSQPGTPRFAGAGVVPGFLLNKYAMSEWNGNLRVAATTDYPWREFGGQDSSVYVLSTDGPVLRQIGHVGGLGHNERIYSVRFTGAIGYVVTFRQVDPLYIVDLSDPTRPTVRGALKLQGYSAYLHPVDDTHVIGVGQDADSVGHIKGTQVSLFDVSDPSAPVRTAHAVIADSSSQAEFDPHAFLYWPQTGSLVLPISNYTGVQEAVEFHVSSDQISKVGAIHHPGDRQYALMLRALVIGSTLWTLSDTGLMASDLGTLHEIAWVPFG